jgi:hypothetical protein
VDCLLAEQPLVLLLLSPSILSTVLLIMAIGVEMLRLSTFGVEMLRLSTFGVEMLRLSTDPFFAMLKFLLEEKNLLLENVNLTFLDPGAITIHFPGVLLACVTLEMIILGHWVRHSRLGQMRVVGLQLSTVQSHRLFFRHAIHRCTIFYLTHPRIPFSKSFDKFLLSGGRGPSCV